LIIPSHDLVVVRLGHYRGAAPGERSFSAALALLMQAVPRNRTPERGGRTSTGLNPPGMDFS
jgi:hypothetical protein